MNDGRLRERRRKYKNQGDCKQIVKREEKGKNHKGKKGNEDGGKNKR